jgi:hypothetical protein
LAPPEDPPHASFGAAMKAVAWSFFGVRKGRDQERDAVRLNPIHVVIAAVLATALFVLVLILIVNHVVK